jgi:VanZ family protein
MPRLPITDYRLKLLLPALALIVVTTAIPVDLRAPVGWDGSIELFDIVVNLVLYAPLGLALRGWSWRRLLVAAALLSAAIELSQVWNSGRHPSPGDVVANAGGALLAMAFARRRWRDKPAAGTVLTVGRPLVAAALVALAALVAAGNLPTHPSQLEGWDPGYPLLLGNEATGDRPWRGTIEFLALEPARLSPTVARHGAGAANLLPANIVADGGPAQRLPADLARSLATDAQQQNALTVVARIVPATTDQRGPARIVSFSADTQHRNFDLGQEGRRLVFRVRTPVSGENGSRQQFETTPMLRAGKPATIVATYDGRVARVYVDGRLCGRRNFAAAASAGPVLLDEELPAVCAVLGALLALIARAFAGSGRRSALAAAVVTALVALALPRAMPGLAAALSAMPWAVVGALIGAAAVVIASPRGTPADNAAST